MTVKQFLKQCIAVSVVNHPKGFIEFIPPSFHGNYAGWKYTIIGKTIEDSVNLFMLLGDYLNSEGYAFKIGTKRLVDEASDEQKIKLMTIYIVNDKTEKDIQQLEHYLVNKLDNYKGHEGISLQFSEHVHGALYKRRDIDPDGFYVRAEYSNLKV